MWGIMKNKTRLVSIILFLSVFILLVSFGDQKSEWEGRIEIKDGVKIINNPGEPLYGEIKFELEEDLSIGNEDDDNYMFYRVRGIEVDAQGNIYVIDWGNHRIQIFDWNGNYLQTLGRYGQGPGEFQWSMQLKICDSTGKYYIRDGTRFIKVFNKQGKYLEQIQLEKSISDFILNGKGNFVGIQLTLSEIELSKTLCKLDTRGKVLNNFAKFPYDIFFQKRGEMEAVVSYPYAHDLFMSKIDEKKIVYAYSRDYELNIIDSDGILIYKIKKDATPQIFSVKERRQHKRFNVPPHKPFFYSIFTDSYGRIYVQKNRTHGLDFKINREVDIFSKDGYYLYKSTIPRGTYIIKDGYIYVYVMDENKGDEIVKRYQIKNWDQIKEGI